MAAGPAPQARPASAPPPRLDIHLRLQPSTAFLGILAELIEPKALPL